VKRERVEQREHETDGFDAEEDVAEEATSGVGRRARRVPEVFLNSSSDDRCLTET